MNDERQRDHVKAMRGRTQELIAEEKAKSGPVLAAYRWIITKDHISDDDNCYYKNQEGPRNLDPTLGLATNPAPSSTFSLYDDDGNCYYEGMLYGDFEGFEPLDDFGTPNAGCTAMKLDGEWL